MRVLHVAPSFSPSWGGPATALTELLPRQNKAGLTVDLCVAAGYRVGTPGPVTGPSEIIVLRTDPFARLWTGHSSQGARVLSSLVDRSNIVHIHEVWHHPGFLAATLAMRKGIPYVISPHGAFSPGALRQKRFKKAAFLALFQRSLLAGASAIQCLTNAEEAQVGSLGLGVRTPVIPNGVNPQSMPRDAALELLPRHFPHLGQQSIILYLGRLHRGKGLGLLISAFAVASRKLAKCRLVIAGPDDGYGGYARDLVQRLGLSARVVFTGPVYGVKKEVMLAAADIFVLPSRFE
ncbi:MAG: glycosyltransferase, partial [Candidatus Nanopelagicales bacterium]